MNAERYGAEKNKKNKKIREGVAPTVGCSLGGGYYGIILSVFLYCVANISVIKKCYY